MRPRFHTAGARRLASRIGVLFFCLLGPVCAAESVEPLARAHRAKPSPATRNALLRYAATHRADTEGALALLSLGVSAIDTGDWEEALRRLRTARPRLKQIDDYIAYFIASAEVELTNHCAAIVELEPQWNNETPGPLSGKAALLAGRAYAESGASREAIAALRKQYSRLPQPEGDLALAAAYEQAGEAASAAVYYQLIYYQLPKAPQAREAGAALERLRESLGASYPPPMPQLMLERAGKLLDAGDSRQARREYQDMVEQVGGVERDIARVRLGVVDYRIGNERRAREYLESLALEPSEADAERLYYLFACSRRLEDIDAMRDAVARLHRSYARSPWRLRATVEAANHFLLTNDGASFESLYHACYKDFPFDPQATYCHWKVAWSAYLNRRPEAASLLVEHVRRFPESRQVPAALYFLGRLAERSGDFGAARSYLSKIRQSYPYHYYSLVAEERLAQRQLASAVGSSGALPALDGVELPQPVVGLSFEPSPATRRRIERARLLALAGLAEWAEPGLRFEARADSESHILAAELADIAMRRGAHDQAIRYIKSVFPEYLFVPFEAAPLRFWKLAFPLPYRASLEKHARAQKLDPWLFAGLIRQESEFNPEAISRAGAHGLTQVLPSTGRSLTRKLRLGRFRRSRLLTPDFNMRLGSYYLRSMLDDFNGALEPALASYNGGKSRVTAWLGVVRPAEPAEFVETIPLTETRDYVQTVVRQGWLYRRIYGSTKKK